MVLYRAIEVQVSSKWKRNLSNWHKFHKADKIVKFTSSTNSFKIFCLQHISRQGVFYFLTQDHLRENSSKEYTSLRAIFFNQCPPLKSSPFFFFPVDGQWSEWKPWTECTRSCGGGIQTRARACNNPSPAHGGSDCVGRADGARPCNSDLCPGRVTFLR